MWNFHLTIKQIIIVATMNPIQINSKIKHNGLFILNLLINSKIKIKAIIKAYTIEMSPKLYSACQSTFSDYDNMHEIIQDNPKQTPIFVMANSRKH